MSDEGLNYNIIKGLIDDIMKLEAQLAAQLHVNTVFDICFSVHEKRIAVIEDALSIGKITDPGDAPPHTLH